MSTVAMSRWIAAVGALGVLAGLYVSVAGFGLSGDHEELLRHASTGLVASLLGLFAQSWFAIFLLGSARALGAEGTARPDDRRRLRRVAARVAVAALLAAAATALAFLSGMLAYARELHRGWHLAVAAVALLSQVATLVLGVRAVVHAERLLHGSSGEPGDAERGATGRLRRDEPASP